MAYVRKSPFFFKKNVSVEMLKSGLASIYVAKGAQYSGLFDQFQKYEAKAK
jgi:endonuclease YncB( thermonuclease family)